MVVVIWLVGALATLLAAVAMRYSEKKVRVIPLSFTVVVLMALLWPVGLWLVVGLWWYERVQLASRTPEADQRFNLSVGAENRSQVIAITGACGVGAILSVAFTVSLVASQVEVDDTATNSRPENSDTPEPTYPTLTPVGEFLLPKQPSSTAVVLDVLSGSRFLIHEDGKEAQIVRAIGVTSSGPAGECWGRAARKFAERALLDKSVQVRHKDAGPSFHIVDITLSGARSYSLIALREGAVSVSARDVEPSSELRAAESSAIEARKGLWGIHALALYLLRRPLSSLNRSCRRW